MRDQVKSIDLKNSKVVTSFGKLTKAQLIEIIKGRVSNPLTSEDLQRCAALLISNWCETVISGQFASMHDLSTCLSSLEKVYKLGQRGR